MNFFKKSRHYTPSLLCSVMPHTLADLREAVELDLALAMEKKTAADYHLKSAQDLFPPGSTWGGIMETPINDLLSKAREADLSFRMCLETYELLDLVSEIAATEIAATDATDAAIAAAVAASE